MTGWTAYWLESSWAGVGLVHRCGDGALIGAGK